MASIQDRLTGPKSLWIWIVGLGLLAGALVRLVSVDGETISLVVLAILVGVFGYATLQYSKQRWTATQASRLSGRIGGVALVGYLTVVLSVLIPAILEVW